MVAGDTLFQVFQAFQTYILSVSSECCKSQSRMLDILRWQYTHVASLCFNCFMCFRHLFQMFHLNVSKVDLVLHMLQWLYLHCFKCFTCVQTYVVNVLSE